MGALSALAPVGKGVALGLAKALGKRVVKTGVRAARGAALGIAGTGIGCAVRKVTWRKNKN